MNEVNIRVIVRVRPFLPQEKLAKDEQCIKILSSKQLVVGKDRGFTFDHILPIDSSQLSTYESCVLPLITSGFQGYNATILAYGPTGSGKTYTMGIDSISTGMADNIGLLPRALQDIFRMQEELSHKRDFILKITYIEIYKEEVHDLLNYNQCKTDLIIRENQHGNTVVSGAVEIECSSFDVIMAHLARGSALRRTGSTQVNMHSSRSHAIFTVIMEQNWFVIDDQEVAPSKLTVEHQYDSLKQPNYACAKFHFVDLAGSERAMKTGNSGTSLKESTFINGGLLAIGNVISALSDPKRKCIHIPYRDSKITRLLKDSLGGNAKTIMICCVSPSSFNFEESLNAMKYANRARNIKNKPIINIEHDNLIMQEMKIEIQQLREQVKSSISMNSANGSLQQDMDGKLTSVMKECETLRLVVSEAYLQFTEYKSQLPQDAGLKIQDWLDFVDEMQNKDSAKQWRNERSQIDADVKFYEEKIEKLSNDLKSDIEIFALKSRELSDLQNDLKDLQYDYKKQQETMQSVEERNQMLEQQLVEKQLRINEILKTNQELMLSSTKEDEYNNGGGVVGNDTLTLVARGNGEENDDDQKSSKKRSKSVSAGCSNNRTQRDIIHSEQRAIHTSPAVMSADRVIQHFNARKQIVLSRLEESDEVRQRKFSEDENDEDQILQQQQERRRQDDTHIGDANSDKSLFQRNDIRRGTYKLSKASIANRPVISSKSDVVMMKNDDLDELIPRVKENEMKLRRSTADLQQFKSEINDLGLKIRHKEQLIQGLVVSGKDITNLNKQYESKIISLEEEKLTAIHLIEQLQKSVKEFESSNILEKADSDKQIKEFKKQMQLAQTNLSLLQKKYNDAVKIASLTSPSENRIQSMELVVEKLKGSQALLVKQLKEQTESRIKLERETRRDQQKLSELQVKHDNQQKVLKIKTNEVSSMQRRLRNNNNNTTSGGGGGNQHHHALQSNNTSGEEKKLDEQKKWLDNEIEKVLLQRKYYDELEKELANRENIIKEKEGMLKERDGLIIKKMRSSQVKDTSTVYKSISEDMTQLQLKQEKLAQQSNQQDDRRLLEVEEAIDGLNAAIEFRNETIDRKHNIIAQSIDAEQCDDKSLMLRLDSLNPSDIRNLLARYFDKVISLRETICQKDVAYDKLKTKIQEDELVIFDLHNSLRNVSVQFERQISREHEQSELRSQLLIAELAGRSTDLNCQTRPNDASSDTVQQLQEKLLRTDKDLLFYRTTCKDLKAKIKELMRSNTESGELMSNRKDGGSDRLGEGTGGGGSSGSWSTRRNEKPLILQQAPMRISRREVRRISDEEVSTRRSSINNDSLDNKTP